MRLDSIITAKKKNLPGTDLPQDLGRISDRDLNQTKEVQKTQSVESAGLVVTEKTPPSKSLLPNKPPKEQYDFAVSFIKVGDYEDRRESYMIIYNIIF